MRRVLYVVSLYIVSLLPVFGCQPSSQLAAVAATSPTSIPSPTPAATAAEASPTPSAKPKTQPTVVAKTGPCGVLPSVETLRTWKTKTIKYTLCVGSQGPRPPPGGYKPHPVEHPGVVKDLGDGTFIVKQATGCVRARFVPECNKKCLPTGTRIATPDGEVRVETLHAGDVVWTRDANDERVPAHVLRVSRVVTPPDHELMYARFADGRTLRVSAGHPDIFGLGVETWSAGDHYDGSQILDVERVTYEGPATYDLLPDGATGIYWANGVALKSTLPQN